MVARGGAELHWSITLTNMDPTSQRLMFAKGVSGPQYKLYAWGYNASGQLGLGNTTDRSSPVQVGSLTNWNGEISHGGQGFSHFIKTDGTLWATGFNGGAGYLGNASIFSVSSPVQIGSGSTWSKIYAGSTMTGAIKTDGTLWTWGSNQYGQLGIDQPTYLNFSSPTQVGTLTTWSKISCWAYGMHAIKTDGTLWVWGSQGEEQGSGTSTTTYSSPVQIGSGTDWASVSGGSTMVLATKTGGTLWAWGQNYSGQVGDGTTTSRSSPVQIGSLTTWSKVFACGTSSFAIKTDGTLWAWGDNYYGNLGLGDTTNRSSPVQVGALTNWSSLSNVSSGVVALKTDGTLWSWGNNGSGQLGLGDTVNRSSPVQIGSLTTWHRLITGYGSSHVHAVTNA